MNSKAVYKEDGGYITDGYRLLNDTQRGIQDYFNDFDFAEGENVFLSKKPTEITNEFEIMRTSLDLKNYFLVDHKFQDVDTDMAIVVEISIKIREGIVEE